MTEIVRLVNHTKELREAVSQVQRVLLDATKAAHNHLPHEGKSDVKKKDSPLLPRFDA